MSYQHSQPSHPTFHLVVSKLKHLFKRCRHRRYSMQSTPSMTANFSFPQMPRFDQNKELDFRCSPTELLQNDCLFAKQPVDKTLNQSGAPINNDSVVPTTSTLPQKTVNAAVITAVHTLPPRSFISKSKHSLPTSTYPKENTSKNTLSQDRGCKTFPQVLLDGKLNSLSAKKEHIKESGPLNKKSFDVKKHPMLRQEIIAEISGENIQFRLKMVDETTMFEPIVLSPQPFPSLIWPAPKTKQQVESQNYGYF